MTGRGEWCQSRADLLPEVEAFGAEHGLTATRVGILAASDPRIVHDMRNGRLPRAKTCQRVREWMASFTGWTPKISIPPRRRKAVVSRFYSGRAYYPVHRRWDSL